MNKLPILYSFRRCPYAIRARMALQAGQRHVELREILLKDKAQEFLDISPKATVPVLVLEDGEVLDESLDIMHWALSSSSESTLHVVDGWKSHELIKVNDGEFKQHLDHYKYADRFSEASESDYRNRAMADLQRLNSILSKQAYLAGSDIGVLDIAIFPFIRQFAGVDRIWFDSSELFELRNWLNTLLNSDIYLSVMQKHKRWNAADTPVIFPTP